jgi:hypothetical protein
MLEPAKTVIDICGGPGAAAEMAGVHKTNVYRWTYPKTKRGGTGGLIPSDKQPILLSEARRRGIDLRPEHFFVRTEAGAA